MAESVRPPDTAIPPAFNMQLTPEQIEFYDQQGYLAGIKAMEESDVLPYREQFDALQAEVGREKAQVGLMRLELERPFVWQLATNSRVLDAIESLIGPDILLLGTHFFCKYGPTPSFVAWHQDVTYWDLDPPEATTAWFAVDASDQQNGCMLAIPETHRWSIQEHGTSATEGNLLSVNQELVLTAADEQRAVSLELRPGEISIHHGHTAHSSCPNLSDRRRCGLAMRYIRPKVKPNGPGPVGGWQPRLVRGQDQYHHFGNHELPRFA